MEALAILDRNLLYNGCPGISSGVDELHWRSRNVDVGIFFRFPEFFAPGVYYPRDSFARCKAEAFQWLIKVSLGSHIGGVAEWFVPRDFYPLGPVEWEVLVYGCRSEYQPGDILCG